MEQFFLEPVLLSLWLEEQIFPKRQRRDWPGLIIITIVVMPGKPAAILGFLPRLFIAGREG